MDFHLLNYIKKTSKNFILKKSVVVNRMSELSYKELTKNINSLFLQRNRYNPKKKKMSDLKDEDAADNTEGHIEPSDSLIFRNLDNFTANESAVSKQFFFR